MNFKLFFWCGVVYLGAFLTGMFGIEWLSRILFYIFIILVLVNFAYTVAYVVDENKRFFKKGGFFGKPKKTSDKTPKEQDGDSQN